MNNIIDLEDYKEHYVINCGDTVHVISVATFHDVLSGEIEFSDIEHSNQIAKAIITEWAVMKGSK